MSKTLSQAAILALQEALTHLFWFKKDLKRFTQRIVQDSEIINKINWDDNKRNTVTNLIDLVLSNTKGSEILTRVCYEVTNFKSFHHLEVLEDGAIKAKNAKDAVEKLRSFVIDHQAEQEAAKLRVKTAAEAKKITLFRQELGGLREQYLKLVALNDPQERGKQLESLMYSLFNIFDLDPKVSFVLNAEQIDGAFSLEGTDYIFEAKWQQQSVSRADLDAFQGKIDRKLDNTLGLFLSINGFSKNAVELFSASRCGMILMDGGDLLAVLEERIDFTVLLIRKKKHAATTGNIYLSYSQIIAA